MKCFSATWLVVLSACLQWTCSQNTAPGSVFDCCEGDILILLDSSGSVSSYEFSNLLRFLVDLLHPFLLGHGRVRVGLVQVHTEPKLEFDFDTYTTQHSLQEALLRTQQLHGDTNNEGALQLAQRLLENPQGHDGPPRVLLWLTDGVDVGNVDRPMAALHQEGVSVLAVSTGHTNYQVLRQAVTPPIEAHLHFVDAEDISIITEDLREAIIELIRAERLQVQDVTSHSAVLRWRPLLIGGLGHYELRYGTDTSTSSQKDTLERGQIRTLTLPGGQTWAELSDLHPDTPYRAWLIPHAEQGNIRALTSSFRTLPGMLTPATVSVSESGPERLRVSWGPLLPAQVQRYRVEYAPIPRGDVRTATLTGRENSTLLTQLQPDTQYLITVVAVHSSGQERAMSVRACTLEVLPGLADLQLTLVGLDSVKVDWRAWSEGAGLQGYWVRWEAEGQSSSSSSSRYLPAQSLSTILTRVSPASRVCVSPVYRTARGEGLCCSLRTHTVTAPWE